LSSLLKHRAIVIDTETTGLCAGEDEILQLSIISESGEKLFDSYFRPLHKSWSAEQAVNNISPNMVANAPSIADKAAEIQRILNSADTIIGYNTSFDADFITAAGLVIPQIAEIGDIIPVFAENYRFLYSFHYCNSGYVYCDLPNMHLKQYSVAKQSARLLWADIVMLFQSKW